VSLAKQVEAAVQDIEKDVKIAVMGCIVNGPGEAREADLGVAGGDGIGLLFRHGEILRKVPEQEIVPALLEELAKM
jgi:(E)-4-hydroxy-3-methylbut-2-enyl-diphosphate synthase